MISPHVDIQPSRPQNLLQLPLWSGRPPQIIKSTHNPQHSRQSDPTRLPTKTGMRSESVMDIRIYGSVDSDYVRIGEEFGFSVRTNEIAEDFVARLNLDRAASIIDSRRYGGFAIRAEGRVEPDAFHCVVQELVVCFGAFDFGPLVDIGEVFTALV